MPLYINVRSLLFSGILLLSLLPRSIAADLDSLRSLYKHATSKGEASQYLGLLSFELSKTNPDSALLLALHGLELGRAGHSDLGVSDCMNAAGWSYFSLGKNDAAILYLDSSVHLFHKIGATAAEIRSLINLSVVYNRQKRYEQALACLLPARKMSEKVNDDNAKAYAELQIGIVYRQQGQYAKSLSYLKSSVAGFKKANAKVYVADALSSLGALYIYLNEPDSSLMCYHQMLSINKSLGNSNGVAFAYENTGDAYVKKAEFKDKARLLDSSLYCYRQAEIIFKAMHDDNDAIYEQFNIGKTLRRMKDYAGAYTALESSFHYFDTTHAITNAYDAALELVLLYKEQQRYAEALHYTEIGQKYKDTLDTRNRSGDMAEMLARYETERKDQTIRLLNTQQLLYKQQLSRTRVILGFSGLLVLLILALAFAVFSRNRIRRQLQEVSLRNQLARDLHDDIGSSLSSIMLLSKMGSTAGLSGGGMHQQIIDKIDFTSRDIMERMSDIVWSMNPKYDRFINLKEKIETHFVHVRDVSEINTQIIISDEIVSLKLPMELRKNLFLIVKEAVNNVLKYADATMVKIQIEKRGNDLSMAIMDDGKGFNTEAIKEGNGMDSMKHRAQNINGTFSVQSTPGKGTTITITAVLPHIR